MGNLIIFVLLVIVVAIAAVAESRLKPRGKIGLYKARQLMTNNELEFFGRLICALPDHYVFPQVAMSALLEASDNDRKRACTTTSRLRCMRSELQRHRSSGTRR